MNIFKRPATIILIVVVVIAIVVAVLSYRLVIRPPVQSAAPANAVATVPPVGTVSGDQAKGILPVQSPSQILGIEGDTSTSYPGIAWVRIAYPSCGSSHMQGAALKDAVQQFHKDGVRVLLTMCQQTNKSQSSNNQSFKDAAQSQSDAVQCGNEQMKRDQAVSFLYMSPQRFASFYDACEQIVHAANPQVHVLLGSLDPHVGGIDYQPLVDQAHYLDQMQQAMNTSVHPGGHWDWHTQTLGLIDSWHNGWNSNGYADSTVNSLEGLFKFWAQQFNVDLNSGGLGEHLWVVEGTGCFKGCGVDPNNPAQVAISHLLALVTDVQTSTKYGVPLFYFSGKDFFDQGINWPIGVLDAHGSPKPLRQDLSANSRALDLTCGGNKVTVVNQLQLLARLYQRCTLPADYTDTVIG